MPVTQALHLPRDFNQTKHVGNRKDMGGFSNELPIGEGCELVLELHRSQALAANGNELEALSCVNKREGMGRYDAAWPDG